MLLGDTRLGERRRSLIENSAGPVLISVVSGFEVATKTRIRKLPQADRIASDFEKIFDEFEFKPLGLTLAHCLRAGRLDGEHRDPFDRLIAGQALVEGLSVMTDDAAFKAFGVEVVW
jgi:PIN domain nuclease of toxin-antitoxin system